MVLDEEHRIPDDMVHKDLNVYSTMFRKFGTIYAVFEVSITEVKQPHSNDNGKIIMIQYEDDITEVMDQRQFTLTHLDVSRATEEDRFEYTLCDDYTVLYNKGRNNGNEE